MSLDPRKTVFAVVNYDGGEMLLDCVRSLTSTSAGRAPILIVDNASTDGSAERARAAFPGQVEVLRLEENAGFGAGTNRALDWGFARGAELVVLVNSDAELEKNFLERFCAGGDPDGLITPKLLFREPAGLLNSRNGSFDLWTGRAREPLFGRPDDGRADAVRFDDQASACVLGITRGAFEKIGRFDEGYFLYYEDTDYFLRAKARGLRVKFLPDARATHREGGSTGGRLGRLNVYYTNRNRVILMRRHASLPARLFFPAYYLAGRLLTLLAFLIRGRAGLAGALLKGGVDGFLGRTGRAKGYP